MSVRDYPHLPSDQVLECPFCGVHLRWLTKHLRVRHPVEEVTYDGPRLSANQILVRRMLWIEAAGRQPYWTRERIIAALRRVSKDGYMPSWRAMGHLRRSERAMGKLCSVPTLSTIRKHFGSIAAAAEAAGLQRVPRGGLRRPRVKCRRHREPYRTTPGGYRWCAACRRENLIRNRRAHGVLAKGSTEHRAVLSAISKAQWDRKREITSLIEAGAQFLGDLDPVASVEFWMIRTPDGWRIEEAS